MQNENKAYPMSRLLEEKSACPRQKQAREGIETEWHWRQHH